jgi:hypothetical protein
MVDTTFFYMNWDLVSEVMMPIVVLAFILERALSLMFEHRAHIQKYSNKGLKEPIVLLVASAVCRIRPFEMYPENWSRKRVSEPGDSHSLPMLRLLVCSHADRT